MYSKIIVKANPFTILQQVYVWTERGSEKFEFDMQELPSKLTILAKQYNIKDIDLIGNEGYLIKVKNDIINSKFDKQWLNITINKTTKGE